MMKSFRTQIPRRWPSAAGLRSRSSAVSIPCGQNVSRQQGNRATYATQRLQAPYSQVPSISAYRTNYSIPNAHPHRVQQRPAYSTNATTAKEPSIHNVFEPKTGTWQFIVADPATSKAVIIDPVLDYDP